MKFVIFFSFQSSLISIHHELQHGDGSFQNLEFDKEALGVSTWLLLRPCSRSGALISSLVGYYVTYVGGISESRALHEVPKDPNPYTMLRM